MKLKGKIALVTGGYRGMGRATAELFARQGATVIASDIFPDAPQYSVSGISYEVLDVSSADDWKMQVAGIIETHERIDILVNAAGVTQQLSEPHVTDLAEWNQVIAVNQTGTMLGMREVSAAMVDRAPLSIVNISSIWGLVAGSGQLAYHASKGAVTVMTKNAAVTYAKRGIRVNGVLPGLIETEMVKDQPKKMREATLAFTPMGRVGEPDEVANAILFLASDDASYITGALLPVDGGFTAA
ncbi:SDR family NAD(P)-dependent oxidoreductase [Hoeflea sp.]|uniref:SDR family NAD(P)-dependent oxidoreductase n=1 Tax=Hoeflea sp. TaxID=1940281 RepID=UPI003B521177